MKKFLLVVSLLVLHTCVGAQPWMNDQNTKPELLKDIIDKYNSENHGADDDHEVGDGVIKEGRNYQFDRWLWYWKQHLDANGYLVSPIKTWEAWKEYQEKNFSNKLAKLTTGSSAWTFQGPDTSQGGYSGLGRINVVSFHPTDSNTFWIGSPGGGAWKTANNGATWTAMTDKLPLMSVSDIDFNSQNPNTIYLCTGDRDGGDYYSVGVLKSVDGGNSWKVTGLNWTTSQYRQTNALVINKLDSNCLLVATSNGIYKSTNGGASWINRMSGNFKDLVYNPADTNILYAATTNGSTTNAQIYRSTNGGSGWTQVTNFTNTGRICLAVTAANSKIVKALVSSSATGNENGLDGIYTSSDSGGTFRQTYAGGCDHDLLGYDDSAKGCGGQGWYDLCITMSPLDSNKVYIGGVNSWYSADGGSNWSLMTFWYYISSMIETAHADKHYMAINPLRPGRLFQCNDGGVYMTDNPASVSSWVNRVSDGLGITEFYRNAVGGNADYVLGGAQDNGTKKIKPVGSISASYDVGGGDGMNCVIDYADNSTYYYAFQNGSINIHTSLADSSISKNVPGNPTGAWTTPFVLMPSCHTCIIVGYKNVFLSTNQGTNWTSISDVLTPYSYSYIERIALTPADSNTVYVTVGYSDTVYYTHNLGVSWSKLHVPYTDDISDIKADVKDKDHIWVSFSGYDTIKVAEYKPGSGWKAMSENLPNVPVSCIEEDTSNGDLYIGTELGVFYRNDTGSNWQAYNNGLPSIRVNDLGINYITGEIWAATYGRGMWRSPKQVADTTTTHTGTGISIIPFAFNSLTVSPNPNRGAFTLSANDVTNKQVTVRIIDNAGRTCWQQTGIFDGNNNLEINTRGLARGTYIVDIKGDTNIGRQKVVIY